MRRIAVLFLTLLLTQSCLPTSYTIYTGSRVHPDIGEAYSVSTRVFLRNSDGALGSASGVVLKWRNGDFVQILTCRHVALAIHYMNLQATVQAGGTSTLIEVKPYVMSTVSDLAILKSVKRITYDRPEVRFSHRVGLIGQPIFIIGNPNSAGPSITVGVISFIQKRKSGIIYHTDADIYKGSSGGGMFNYNQELIGIAYATLVNKHFNFIAYPAGGRVIGIESIVEFLRATGQDFSR